MISVVMLLSIASSISSSIISWFHSCQVFCQYLGFIQDCLLRRKFAHKVKVLELVSVDSEGVLDNLE